MNSRYGRRYRDPVHGYIYVPRPLLALVNSPYVTRLRFVSQNAGAQSSYPSLNGSRFEHALGTMHLSMSAWKWAWANASGSSDIEDAKETQARLAHEVRQYLRANPLHIVDPFIDQRLSEADDRESWSLEFPELMQTALAAVGLLHDVGHSPFSHTLEPVFSGFRHSVFSAEVITELEALENNLVDVGKHQFHDLCGLLLVRRALSESHLLERFSPRLVWGIYSAAYPEIYGSPHWARALRSVISGDVDVDRLDYILRDSNRAGTEFGAVDVERLLRGVELHHRNDEPARPWSVGYSVSTVSAVESLLENRERSYRWVYFHHASLASDTALKRVFRLLLLDASERRPSIDYLSALEDMDGKPRASSHADDVAALSLMRQGLGGGADAVTSMRYGTLMRIADGFSQDYVSTWRSYEEYLSALADAPSEWVLELLGAVPSAGSFSNTGSATASRSWSSSEEDLTAAVNWVIDLRTRQGGLDGPERGRISGVELLELELEEVLNNDHPEVSGVPGTWLVALRLGSRSGRAARFALWRGDEQVEFRRVSPIAAGLVEADRKRVQAWGFFVPHEPRGVSREARKRLALEARQFFLVALIGDIGSSKQSLASPATTGGHV